MATIYDKGDNWHLIINQNAKPVKNIDEPSKGYSATLGEDETGKHVVMDVHYNKDRYSISEIQKFLERSRSCPQCAALDKEKMNLDSIEFQDPPRAEPMQSRQANQFNFNAGQATQQEPAPQHSQSPLKDIFANVFFDAYLTTPGKYFLGMMLNDDRILESAMPKTPDGLPVFMEEMVDFLAGKIDFVRSPDEVKDYLSVLKKDDDSTSSTRSGSRTKKRRAGTPGAMLIY